MRAVAVRALIVALVMTLAPIAPSPALASGSADLSASLLALDPTFTSVITQTGAGTAYAYQLAIANGGPDTATGVMGTLILPPGALFTGALPAGDCTASGATVTCLFGSIGALGGLAKVVNVTAPTTTGTATAVASASANESDPNPAHNTTSLALTIFPAHDLDITKSASPSPVGLGGAITYSITLHNGGPSDAQIAGFVDTIPLGTTFVSITSSTALFCGAAGIGFGPRDYACRWDPLASGATVTATLVVLAPLFPTTVRNSIVDFFGPPLVLETDPNPANDSMTLDTDVVAGGPTPTPVPTPTPTPPPVGVDMRITKSASTGYGTPAAIGGPVFYQIGVDGNGKSSSGFTITDTIPSGVTLTSYPTSICSYAAPVLTCTSSGLGVVFSLDGVITHGGTITNTASVTGIDADPDATNNTASATIVVPSSVDLAIVKAGPASALAGGTMSYTLTVTNNGPDPSTGSTVTDALPAGATLVSASAGCSGSSIVTCPVGALAVGASTSLSIQARAPGSGPVTNSATVVGNETDPDHANDNASATTTVVPLSDLSLTKTTATTSIAPGGSISYTIVATNRGPSADPIVGIEDTPPATLTIAALSCPGAVIAVVDATTGHPLCQWNGVAAGQALLMTVTATLGPTSATAITNSAQTGGTNADPDSSNDRASVTVAVLNTPISSTPETVTPQDSTTGTSPVSLTFTAVTAPGATTLTTSATGPATPSGFLFDGVYYELSTTASFTPPITICIAYTGATLPRLWHYEGGAWVDVTTTASPTQVCGQVGSLSPFVVLRATPAALLSDLATAVAKLPKGLATSLGTKVRAAQSSAAPASCGQLAAFIDEVNAQRGKGLTTAQADSLALAASEARRALCR